MRPGLVHDAVSTLAATDKLSHLDLRLGTAVCCQLASCASKLTSTEVLARVSRLGGLARRHVRLVGTGGLVRVGHGAEVFAGVVAGEKVRWVWRESQMDEQTTQRVKREMT